MHCFVYINLEFNKDDIMLSTNQITSLLLIAANWITSLPHIIKLCDVLGCNECIKQTTCCTNRVLAWITADMFVGSKHQRGISCDATKCQDGAKGTSLFSHLP